MTSTPLRKQQRLTADELSDALRRMLADDEPRLIRLLYDTWGFQRGDLVYADLVQGARDGTITPGTLASWQRRYIGFVNNRLVPMWQSAAFGGRFLANEQLLSIGAAAVQPDAFRRRLNDWTAERAGLLITNLIDEQRSAVNEMLRWHIANDPLTPDELGVRLRAMIGLTRREERAVRNRFQLLRDNGELLANANEEAARYAAYLHRIRATRIARTELAAAWNQGHLDTYKEAQANGDITEVERCWQTAEDERVCRVCGPLNEQCQSGLESVFRSGNFAAVVPPIHPSCRCTILYTVR